jgi:hypothetical protein
MVIPTPRHSKITPTFPYDSDAALLTDAAISDFSDEVDLDLESREKVFGYHARNHLDLVCVHVFKFVVRGRARESLERVCRKGKGKRWVGWNCVL